LRLGVLPVWRFSLHAAIATAIISLFSLSYAQILNKCSSLLSPDTDLAPGSTAGTGGLVQSRDRDEARESPRPVWTCPVGALHLVSALVHPKIS
jgi:hypothetical protein